MKSAIVLLLMLIAPQARDATRAPAIGTARISGRVVASGDPATAIRRAIVTIRGAALAVPQSIVSDDNGAFTFDRLPAGRFTVTATKAAYLPASFGATKPGKPGTPLAIADGQQVTGIILPLARGGVIAGIIRKPSGEAAPGLRVVATKAGEPSLRSLTLFIAPANDSTVTDDRGGYRIFGLAPGDYTIAALPASTLSVGEAHRRSEADVDAIFRELQTRRSQPSAPPASTATTAAVTPVFGVCPVFFPGTAVAADATPVAIAAGAVRDDVDFVVGLVPSASVEGTVVRTGDVSGAPINLIISGAGQATPLMLTLAPRLVTSPGPDGHFKYVNVTPGHYTITALARPAASGATPARGASADVSLYWASAEVDINGQDVSGLSLAFQPALNVSGRIVFDAAALAPPADLSGLQVSFDTLPGLGGTAVSNNTAYGGLQRSVFARSGRDGTFELAGLTPGVYRFHTSASTALAGWWLRSVVVDGHDVLDEPLELRARDLAGVVVTFTDRHTELGGTLQTATGQAGSEYVVIAVPANRAFWGAERRVRSTRPATDGHFAFADLPAGDYLLAAVADLDPDDLAKPAFLEAIVSAGLAVTIAEGERKTQDLRISRR